MAACPSCGEENADRARFCSSCGTSLPSDAPLPAVEERKVVSVLFVDLVGFTARSDRADPEDVRATLRVYHERLKREIERFGGTVEKFIGDAVMAVFGAPVAHEDDAERAVRAALRIGEAIEELNEERPGLDLAIRAAVNSGEAVVTIGARPAAGEALVTGDVVNVASRLQGVAPVGGVVVGELTQRSTAGRIDYEALEPVVVKGKEQPLPVWRAVGARSRFGVDVEQGARSPLIGRDHELNVLTQLFGRVVRDRTIHLVTVAGEPGVGKSRLVWEFQRFVDDLPELVSWRQGRCLPYGEGITFWALGEVVKSHAGILENDAADDAASKLRAAVAAVVEDEREREWIRSRLEPLVGLGEPTAGAEREESFAAWRGFLEAIAATDPLVVVIEDVHWADPAMLAFVEHLADWAIGVPMLVLCTARPELYERQPAWGGGARNHTAISLSPLSPEQTARLLSALLDQAVLPAETQAMLLSRAGGNPLYAEEFIRMLVDRGLMRRKGSTWDVTSDEGDIAVPENVHALIAARLDTITPARKALLQDAAVIGKVFWSGALVAMGGVDEREVREGLHELARKELLRPARRASIEHESEYAFWHALIRDVVYGQIPRAARSVKHRAAAEWIEQIAGERIADSAELLVHHYEQALELARAAGSDVGDLEARARRVLLLATERASRLDAEKAKEYGERALALTPPGDPDRLAVLMAAGRTAVTTWGDVSDDVLLEALDEARQVGNVERQAEALTWLARVAWTQGDTARQFELLGEALRILENTPPGRELADALGLVVAAHGLAGMSAETLARSEEALPVVREFGADGPLAILLQFRGQARVDLGDIAGGMEDLREGLRIALAGAPAAMVLAAHVNVADNVWFDGGPAPGQELYEAAADLTDRRGAPSAGDWARMESMWTRYDLGAWDEVLAIGDRLASSWPVSDGRQLSVLAEAYRQDVRLHRGTGDRAVVDEAILPRAREIGDGQVVVPAFRIAALGCLARGDLDRAVVLVQELDERLRGRPGFRSWLLDGAARVCLAAGAVDLLRALIDQGIEHMTRDVNSLASARAALAEAEGDPESALARYEDAAARWGAFPSVLEHGHALAGAGRCLLALDRSAEAATRVRAAQDRYAALGATPLVREMDEVIAIAIAKSS